MLDALGSRTRRQVLVGLLETPPRVGRDVDALLDVDDDRLRMQLRHADLPKLDALELVDWDRSAGTVARGPAFAQLEPVLELFVRHDEVLPAEWL